MAKSKWKMVTTIGPWHKVAHNKAFRFYLREHKEHGVKAWFADYRIDDLVSRHHFVRGFGYRLDESALIANRLLLEMSREDLTELDSPYQIFFHIGGGEIVATDCIKCAGVDDA